MSIEIEIKKLLEDVVHTDMVADELARRWSSGVVNESELQSIAAFLHHSGYYPTLIDLCLTNLENGQPIPWRYFAEALKVIIEDIDYSVVDAIHQEADSQGHLEELAVSESLHVLEPGLVSLRNEFIEGKWQEYLNQKTLIDEQLQVLRTQRMMEQERALLVRFELLFPNDSDVINAKQDFQDRWAREVVQQTSERAPRAQIMIPPDPEDVLEAQKMVAQAAFEQAKEKPEMAYDLAVMMAMMEGYDSAMKILQHAPESYAKDWLQLELLLPSRRFIDALNFLLELELKYPQNPEVTFAVVYYRAQALYGVGQTSKAIDVMKSLVQMKPNYRSASLYLNTWQGTAS